MGFQERISVILDVDSKGGVGGFKSFGASIREAGGLTNKFKAGASSAMDSVKANAGAMAMAGGAALVAFGIKALGAFTDVAMGARDLGAATGLAVEDASRWIAVADDMGLTAADLTTGLGMITKSLDADKWDKYGIATRDASGEARSANDILLDTFDVLSKETNLTERARLGKELLGKGYASLAPMIGKSRAEYEKMLGSVEKGQVVTAEEAKKAQKMAEAQDALSDALKEVTLALGGTVAGLAPLITLLADVTAAVAPAFEAIGTLAEGINKIDWSDPTGGIDGYAMSAEGATQSLDELNAKLAVSGLSAAEQAKVLRAWHDANADTAGSTRELGGATAETTTKTRQWSDAANEAKLATDRARVASEQLAALLGTIDDDSALLNLQQQFDDVRTQAEETFLAVAAGEMTAEEGTRRHELSVNDLKTSVANYGTEVLGLPDEQVTAIIANLTDANVEAVESRLAFLARNRNMNIHAGLIADSGLRNSLEGRASGGPVTAGQPYIVGENRPELFVPDTNGTILPSVPSAGGSGSSVGGDTFNVTINGTNMTDDQIAAAIMRNKRRGRG